METFTHAGVTVQYGKVSDQEVFVRTSEGPFSLSSRKTGGILPPPMEESTREILEALRKHLWPDVA